MRLRNIPGADAAIEGSPFCIKDAAGHRGRWGDAFPKNQPLCVEIGMGKGKFLMEQATRHPECNYLGIERYSSVLLRAVQKMEECPVPNARFLCADAADIAEIFAPGEVSRIYLNFSDPWPKDRHAKRRLTSSRFLRLYHAVLPPGGRIEFKTDNQNLFSFSLSEIANYSQSVEFSQSEESAQSAFSLVYSTRDLHSDAAMMADNVMTEYEEKFSSLGHPICKLIAERV